MDTHYIEPGSPWQNAYGESFNSIFRTTCLNRWLFSSMTEARVLIKQWLEEYNTIRPHGSLDGMNPAKFLKNWIGFEDLKGSKYDWLYNPANMSRKQKQRFKALRDSTLKTARAWAIKELAMLLWHYVSKTWARKAWEQWLSWAVRCRLDPIKAVAKTIKAHLWGILNAIVLKVSNGPAEGLNSRIKMLKIRSRGFRNKERFANAIHFHFGGLDLYPEGVVR